MSVLRETAASFSRSCRNIFYFISDDYDLIPRLINRNPSVFAQRMQGKIDESYFTGNNTYKKLSCLYIQDCHYLFKPSLFLPENNRKIKESLQAKQICPEQQNIKTYAKHNLKETARIFICTDFHLLKETERGMLIKQFLDYTEKKDCLLLLSSPVLALPNGYEQMTEVIDVPGPDTDDIKEQLLFCALSQTTEKNEIDVSTKKRIMEAADDFKGLDFHEIETVLYQMTEKYGSFYGRNAAQKHMPADDNFQRISKARKDMTDTARKMKALKDSTVTLLKTGDQAAGLGRYKEWFGQRKSTIKDPTEARKKGREPIRGVLMTGLPGTGKTQAAKYTAHELGVPLVQLRIDNLLGSLVGDSEKNFKRYRKKVEMLAPCVVLIDEIEKLFSEERSKNGGSSEVKMNIFTALLDWMQENKYEIFFYATCNSVKNLPPELLRDGRFSMRFSVFMPTYQELIEIICFHMKRVNDMTDRHLFEAAEEISDKHGRIKTKAAEEFLNKITEYAVKTKRNMFFTGANIEALINDVQYNITGQIQTADQYVRAMLDSAQSEFCQPYGETNLKDAVNFWLDALENNFTDAAAYAKDFYEDKSRTDNHPTPLSFRRFDRPNGVFYNDGLIIDNNYDRYLYEVFSRNIQQEYRKRSKDDHDMLEQISHKLDQMKR